MLLGLLRLEFSSSRLNALDSRQLQRNVIHEDEVAYKHEDDGENRAPARQADLAVKRRSNQCLDHLERRKYVEGEPAYWLRKGWVEVRRGSALSVVKLGDDVFGNNLETEANFALADFVVELVNRIRVVDVEPELLGLQAGAFDSSLHGHDLVLARVRFFEHLVNIKIDLIFPDEIVPCDQISVPERNRKLVGAVVLVLVHRQHHREFPTPVEASLGSAPPVCVGHFLVIVLVSRGALGVQIVAPCQFVLENTVLSFPNNHSKLIFKLGSWVDMNGRANLPWRDQLNPHFKAASRPLARILDISFFYWLHLHLLPVQVEDSLLQVHHRGPYH